MSALQFALSVVAVLPVYVAGAVTYLHKTRGPAVDWRATGRAAAGLAPDPAETPEAVVQVYAARAWGWRGYFGVHPWIAVKPAGARRYTVYEVNGWQLRFGGSSVIATARQPDGAWYGSRPELLADRRGKGVDELIARIDAAARAYPWARTYRVWPGPNSNTFIACILRAVPELRADLPSTALGKDYLGRMPLARLPSGTGLQFNLFGAFGVAAGWREGLEINLLGLTFGIDPRTLSLKLPLLGRIGGRRSRSTSVPPVDPLVP